MQAPPRRSNRPLALLGGLAAVGAVLALVAGVWLILSLRSPATSDPAPPSAPAPGPAPDGSPSAPPPARVPFELRRAGAEPVRVQLEVAATPAQRRVGLMNRAELADGTGMVFLFPADADGGFWMKNTLVPLSIAFVADDGRVVSVHEMVPCRADPCPVYRPDGPYRYAVELPAGAFPDAGIGPGDEVVPVDPGQLPAAS
jgi:uncharacterized membrane protein (UPF0127 family)